MGPDIQKRKPKSTSDRSPGKLPSRTLSQPADPTHIPLELQQAVLNVFIEAFPLAEGADLKSLIQHVKGHLFKRDFAAAFGREDYLEAYALRWSASRAVAYADILRRFESRHAWSENKPQFGNDSFDQSDISADPKVVCLGGGAGAEVVALAAMVCHLPFGKLNVTAVDIADWSSVLGKLQMSVTAPPNLSPYSSTSAKAANKALLGTEQMHLIFKKQDILEMDESGLRALLAGASLVTIMFTLNELFTSSISKATAFLLTLTDAIEPGCWFLVVDSPGSYSEIVLGKDTQPKRYPMKWLLDHTLLEVAGNQPNGIRKWSKSETDDSRWFRLDTKLTYPISLEDMRYQKHVFRRQGRD